MNQDIKPNGLEVHANLYKQLEVVIWLQNHDPTNHWISSCTKKERVENYGLWSENIQTLRPTWPESS